MGKNILIFSDGTGQAGGFMPDEARSNVYKLFRATRVAPDNSIDPKLQLAFYDAGLGARGEGDAIKITWLRRLYNVMSKATGLGITQNIIDCYTEIIRVWQPGDRIYLFGFSRGAYTVRCVGGVLKACGVPTAVRQPGGRVRPLRRDARSARRIATEAVKHVYQYGGSIKGDPYRNERAKRAARFRHKYFSGDASVSNTAPYFIGAWDTVQTLGAGTRGLLLLALLYAGRVRGPRRCVRRVDGDGCPGAVPAARPGAAAGALPVGLPALQGARQPGQIPPGVLRHASSTTPCAMRATRSPSTRTAQTWIAFPGTRSRRARPSPTSPRPRRPRFKQVWFAGSHSDVGGSYPETESRLSDIALAWMTQEAIEPAAPDLRRSHLAQALSRQRRPAARRAQGLHRRLPSAGLRTVRCGSSTPSTSGGGKSTVASPPTRCCTPRCSSGCGCRRS